MKKNKWFGLALVATMMGASFSACSNEAEEVLAQESEIKLSSQITPSRVANQDLQSTQIVEGQQVGVTINGAKSEHVNINWEAQEDGTLLNLGNMLYWGDSKATVKGYHPYNSTWKGIDQMESFSVAVDQTENSGYLQSDLLWAEAEGTNKNEAIKLSFTHKLAKINITFTSSDISDFKDAIVYICGTNIATLFNPITGDLEEVETPSILDIKAGKDAAIASAIIVPQTVDKGTVFIELLHNSKIYQYTLPAEKEFTSGNSYNYTLNVQTTSELLLKSENIVKWNELEGDDSDIEETIQTTEKDVTLTEAGTLSEYISNYDKYKVQKLKVSGPINALDLRLIRDMFGLDYYSNPTLGILEELDLTDANIIAGSEKAMQGQTIQWDNIMCDNYFENSNLKKIKLPASLERNLSNFNNCLQLEEVICYDGLLYMESFFDNCSSLKSFYVPAGVIGYSQGKFDGAYDVDISVDSENTKFTSINGIVFTKDMKGIVEFNKAGTYPDYTIPDGVEIIQMGAFLETNITSITMPSSILKIHYNSFRACNELLKVYCSALTPPEMGDNFYGNSFTQRTLEEGTLYVPSQSIDAYKVAECWKDFKNIKPIEE